MHLCVDLDSKAIHVVELFEAANQPQTTSPPGFVPVSQSASVSRTQSDAGERRRLFWVFLDWCLQHEAYSKRIYLIVLVPLIVAGIMFQVILTLGWYPSFISQYLFRSLGWVCAFSLIAFGIRHASRAVCWELSVELRELVQLTGIGPSTLLWAQSASRWLTIACSVILVAPLFAYTRTLGGITGDRWIAACWGLLLVTALTAAFSMLASVSSSSAKNADTMAANVTVGFFAVYHCIFWGVGMLFWFLPPPTLGGARAAGQYWFELAPIAQVYRSLVAPELFSPQEPGYWIHFPVAIAGLWLATRIMRNRFHAESNGLEHSANPVGRATSTATMVRWRPRCSERPLLWKDTYILAGGAFAEGVWLFVSFLAMIATILGITSSIVFDNPASIVIAVLMTGSVPWVLALQFDSLMAAEFRERTWGGLLLLPINWFDPIVSKIQAAVWARRWIFPPIIIAASYAVYKAPFPMLITSTIALLALPILIGVSVLSHFNAKKWWAGAIVALFVILLIAALVAIWVIFNTVLALIITVVLMSSTITGFLVHIRWRICNWTGD